MKTVYRMMTTALMTALLVTPVLAQNTTAQGEKKAKQTEAVPTASKATNAPDRIVKFTGVGTLGNSVIAEDKDGRIGIGVLNPTSSLTVLGMVESRNGGIKFPDGTVQTTAVAPGGVTAPLVLTGSVSGAVIHALNDSGAGVSGISTGTPAAGVSGQSDVGFGVLGVSPFNSAVRGESESSVGVDGVSSSGVGVRGTSSTGSGVTAFSFSTNPNSAALFAVGSGGGGAFAGRFTGDVNVNGTLSKAGGSFKIDHPLDPENRYLSHSFVESPDMKNIYDGVITLDGYGEAVVEMPEWFDALNRDYRYLLTAVGAPMPGLYIAEKMRDNRFKIGGGQAGMEVSWQVTGVRKDAWANKNRIPVEEKKADKERGYYLHPEAFDLPEEMGVDWVNNPELMLEMKQQRLEAEKTRGSQE